MLKFKELLMMFDSELTQAFCNDEAPLEWAHIFAARLDWDAYVNSRDCITETELELFEKFIPLSTIIMSKTKFSKELALKKLNHIHSRQEAEIVAKVICMRYALSQSEQEFVMDLVAPETLYVYQHCRIPVNAPTELFFKHQLHTTTEARELLGISDSLISTKINHMYPYDKAFSLMADAPHLFYDEEGKMVSKETVLKTYDDSPRIHELLRTIPQAQSTSKS